jgi:hypothetical protein
MEDSKLMNHGTLSPLPNVFGSDLRLPLELDRYVVLAADSRSRCPSKLSGASLTVEQAVMGEILSSAPVTDDRLSGFMIRVSSWLTDSLIAPSTCISCDYRPSAQSVEFA